MGPGHHPATLHEGKGSGKDFGAGKGNSEANAMPGRGCARDDRAANSVRAPERAERACKKAANKVCKSELHLKPSLPKPGEAVFSALAKFLGEMQNVAEDEEWDADVWEFKPNKFGDTATSAAKAACSAVDEPEPECEADWGDVSSDSDDSSSDSGESFELSEDDGL